MKKAVIVSGPESSGNRLVARLLIKGSGFFGDGDVKQRLDEIVGHAPSKDISHGKVVLVRSFPHGAAADGTRHWPYIAKIVENIKALGFENIVGLMPTRDIWATTKSQVNAGHVDSEEKALRNILASLYLIPFQFGMADTELAPISYEALVFQRLPYWNKLLHLIGEDPIAELPEEITNENLKYYRK